MSNPIRLSASEQGLPLNEIVDAYSRPRTSVSVEVSDRVKIRLGSFRDIDSRVRRRRELIPFSASVDDIPILSLIYKDPTWQSDWSHQTPEFLAVSAERTLDALSRPTDPMQKVEVGRAYGRIMHHIAEEARLTEIPITADDIRRSTWFPRLRVPVLGVPPVEILSDDGTGGGPGVWSNHEERAFFLKHGRSPNNLLSERLEHCRATLRIFGQERTLDRPYEATLFCEPVPATGGPSESQAEGNEPVTLTATSVEVQLAQRSHRLEVLTDRGPWSRQSLPGLVSVRVQFPFDKKVKLTTYLSCGIKVSCVQFEGFDRRDAQRERALLALLGAASRPIATWTKKQVEDRLEAVGGSVEALQFAHGLEAFRGEEWSVSQMRAVVGAIERFRGSYGRWTSLLLVNREKAPTRGELVFQLYEESPVFRVRKHDRQFLARLFAKGTFEREGDPTYAGQGPQTEHTR